MKQVKAIYSKPPLTFQAQVEKLLDHGLLIPNRQKAEFYLSQLNYYRVAAYCLPFEQDHASHRVGPNTSFDDVLNLYIFDRELRLLVLDAIERFEVSLRTKMAYHLSHNHNCAHPHIKPELFFSSDRYKDSLQKLEKEVNRSQEDFIRHFIKKYQEALPPIWAVVELMTMGQLSKWFSNIAEKKDRQDISKNYGVDELILRSFCQHLTTIRNLCAHHARLWNRDFTVIMTPPKIGASDLINSLNVMSGDGRRNRKIYNTLVMLAYLMDVISQAHHWKQRLITLITAHKIETIHMGFPDDWQTRPIWKISPSI